MTARRWLVLLGLAVVGAAIWLWPSSESKPSVATPDATAPQTTGSAPRSRIAPTLAPKSPASGRPMASAPVFDASTHHTADPCTMPGEAAIPAGFESVSAQGITVAWIPGDPSSPGPNHVPLSPIAIAHLVGGLLEEAAAVTGTVRRSELIVIIYRSADEFRSSTKAPSWAGGLYDGGSVRLFVNPSEELGVSISTLRHEIMHAQLHAAIGCMPFWFNEGLAEYLSGVPPLRHWLEMMRAPGAFELSSLRNPALIDKSLEARHVYGVSLAMVLYIIERGGQPGLQQALRDVHGADTRKAIELWDTMYPRVDYEAVLESLALKVFRAPLGQLGEVLDNPLCCHGLSDVNEVSCRAATTRPTTRSWFEIWTDRPTSPRAMCRARW